MEQQRFIRLPEVRILTGLSRSTIYNLAGSGEFPDRVSIGGGRAIGWLESEIQGWIVNLRHYCGLITNSHEGWTHGGGSGGGYRCR